jgi:hypothetical protein
MFCKEKTYNLLLFHACKSCIMLRFTLSLNDFISTETLITFIFRYINPLMQPLMLY